ncbi:TAT-dependent nitrous-oxide reductase [Natrialba sp. SSL1]|uniref:TAT-dependent nitrous-oxide reductase n=1 Tax=Natrialba sp. SSL1 TaxID=1869245 RepID=UPI0008F8F82E|nr:TAT-dependent nitrous-oxide reductase [Natrialba sp. SSL1]OIB58984.1 nitrous-oxide reductase [Natrialba sp. SSL1]
MTDTHASDSNGRSSETTAVDDRDPLFARIPRRDFMKAGAAAGAMSSLAGCTGLLEGDEMPSAADVDTSVPPGELDDYYAFLSGGHSGDIRVYGVPSMRQIMRIPVFNVESARGYGFDDETHEMLQDAGGYTWGDTHHPRVSQTDNEYDGEWLFVNDKANGRMARVDLEYFETDAIIDLPNQQGTHGACALMPDTRLIFGVGELRVPIPNDGRDLEDPSEYGSTLSAMSADPFDHEWDVRVDCNLDNGDSGKNGEWFFTTSYNSEEGVTEAEMTAADTDYVVAFNIPRIEEAVDAGEYETINGVPVVDGTEDSPLNTGSEPLVRYIDVPTNPHGVSVTPDGRYAIASGKLDPTCTIIDIDQLNEVDDPNDAIAGRVNVGNGPLHTAYDGRGHAYTTLFVDSEVVKWDIDAAVEAEMGSADPVIQKHEVHYSPGHLIAAESYTGDPQGDWLIVLNKLSKDRFLPVGPVFPENDQLFYIGDDDAGMELVKDTPAYPEPHDASIVRADRLDPASVYDPDDLALDFISTDDEDNFIERDGDRVHVEMHSQRNYFSFEDIAVQEGDEVTIRTTNIEQTEDMLHSVAIPEYDINVKIAPQETREVTFTADKPGVYWIYCAFFCSALHLEMRSRLLVEPAD